VLRWFGLLLVENQVSALPSLKPHWPSPLLPQQRTPSEKAAQVVRPPAAILEGLIPFAKLVSGMLAPIWVAALP
jgi:hypothetical protein